MNRYIVPTLLVLLAAMVYVAFIDPTYSEIQLQFSKEAKLDKYLEDAHNAQNRLEEFRKIQAGFPPDYEKTLSTILPDSIDPLRLMIDLNGLGDLRGVHLKNLNAITGAGSPDGSGGSYTENTISFTVSASYDLFREFLKDIESSLALRNLSSLSFTADKGTDLTTKGIDPAYQSHDFSVTLKTYSLH